jgi:HAE1 family hydrophobic/amphiphilic exporter-1
MEEELSTVGSLESIRSIATTGITGIFLLFKQGTDMDVAYREVRDRIQRARARLPDDADRVFIRKDDDSGIPVFVLGLAIDPNIADAYDLIQNEVILPLERLDGVAAVEANGLVEKEILIEVDRERIGAAGLNIYELAQQLQGDNFTLASGDVRSAGKKLMLRSVARYGDVEELRQRQVGNGFRLGDIARISYEEPDSDFRVRAMSRPAVAIVVMKEGDANTLEVARRVGERVEEMQSDPRLAPIECLPLFDQHQVIMESLNTLLNSGKIGAFFAVAVLFFFLRRFRLTLIITLSIPLSMVLALTAMYFAGESLNILSLLGLMISVGLLVDNSVVVAENIHRMHKQGLPRREACIRGASEIALAIVMATLTTIIVFLPASLVEGQGQFFLLRLALPICISLAGSLVVALVFIPLAVYLTLPNGGERKEGLLRRQHDRLNSVLERAYERTFGAVNRAYGRFLRFFLLRRGDLVLGVGVIFALSMGLMKDQVSFVDVQEEERSGFNIEVEMPQSVSLEEAEVWFQEAEKVVEENAEELDIAGWFVFHRTVRGTLQGWFNSPRTKDISPREVTERILELLPEKPGFRLYTGEDSQVDDDESESQFAVTLEGEDAAMLGEVADALEGVFVKVEGVLGVQKSGDRSASELALVINRERAQRQGINPQVIAGVVGYALRGQALPRFYRDGKDIPVRVRFQEKDRESLDQLWDFQVPTADGGFVSLASITEVSHLPTAQRIYRNDKRTSRVITLELEDGNEEETRERLATLVAAIDLPEGITFGSRGGQQGLPEDLQGIFFALGLSVVFIYLLMAFLFESFMLPLSIVFTIPLAFIGVVWAHVLAGLDIDFLGAVGVVLLVGVVVNNGIVLIDYVNRLRAAGSDRLEALLMAAERRFRPIMMTALTTICGMIPLLLGGANSIGLSYTSFGTTLIGGMLTATLLTLLVVPVLYTLFEDLRIRVGSVMSWAAKGPRVAKKAEAEA